MSKNRCGLTVPPALRALTLLFLVSTLACARKAAAPPPAPAPTATKDNPLGLTGTPRYAWRGLHFDVARHFFPVADIEHLLDLMALLKLNVFHWHLTDDQGWRLPVAKHPELTRNQEHYSRDEIRHLVDYARARGITIVPEIDMPGHMRALLAVHPELSCRGVQLPVPTTWGIFEDVLCAGNPKTYELVDDILDETAALFPGPYIHLGGDEVPTTRWDACPKCSALGIHPQTHFLAHVTQKVRSLGRRPIAWDEVLDHQPPSDLVIMAWRSVHKIDAAIAAGHDVIIVPNQIFYLDRPQTPGVDENVRIEGIIAYEPPASPHVLGVEAALWTEHVSTRDRAERQLFPRLFAVADLAWSPPGPRRSDFSAARAVLDARGVASFIDPPQGLEPRRAFIDAGTVTLTALEKPITYQLGCSGPWLRYSEPIAISQTTELCARAGNSDPARGLVVVEPPSPHVDAKPGPPGVHFQYFEGTFTALPDFDRLGAPARSGTSATLIPDGVRETAWALRADGLFEAPTTRVYRFTLESDDGSRLTIDGRLVVDNDGLHAPLVRSGEIALEKGWHRARVEFFQKRGGYTLELSPFDLRQ